MLPLSVSPSLCFLHSLHYLGYWKLLCVLVSSPPLPAQEEAWLRDLNTIIRNNNSMKEILWMSVGKIISLLTGFLPPNMSLKKIDTKTTTTATRIPIVRFGCFSAFSMRSCREASIILGSIQIKDTQRVPKEKIVFWIFYLGTYVNLRFVLAQEGNICNLVQEVKYLLLQGQKLTLCMRKIVWVLKESKRERETA